MEDFKVDDRVALVTGAARGIGLAVARELHARGAAVAVVDLDQGDANAAAAAIGERTLPIATDVADETAVGLAVDATVAHFGRLDIVVANAGITQPIRPLSVVDVKAFDRVLAVDLHGVLHTVRQGLPHVIEQRGHVLVISSVYAFVNGAMQSSYAMSKAAVEQLGRSLRVELAPHGASAGVGYFGFVDTAMVSDAFEDPIADRILSFTPGVLQKRISPTEAGEALVDGIEKRAPRTIRPRRWRAYFRLRGLLNPRLDELLAGRQPVREAVVEGERKGREEN
jgi:NAD(P)-dependent dehydrogenase (short-subunit alcohol dehydrogenase family)